MSIKHLAISLAAVISCSAALASPVTYDVDPNHSRPSFSYDHFGFSTQVARFDKMSGKVVLDDDAKTGSMDLIIDMTSLDSGLPLLDRHLKSADFFDVSSHPTAEFKSTHITFDGDRPTSINGYLTLNGVSQPVTFMVTAYKRGPHGMLQNRDSIGGNVVATVSRSAFGLGRYTPDVSDTVNLSVGLEATRE
jgi:polyisoprenoid-binding protein YceI